MVRFKNAVKYVPSLLIVESNVTLASEIAFWCRENEVAPVLAHSAREAGITLSDALFMDCKFDGLIVNFKLPDATAYRVVSDFRHELAGAPVAIMHDTDDVCLKLWTRTRSIQLLRKPVDTAVLVEWLQNLKDSADLRNRSAKRALSEAAEV